MRKALEPRPKIVVIDRDISPGQGGIVFQEIKWALQGVPNAVYGFVSGLGGADITPLLVEKAVMFALKNGPREDTLWLGLSKEELRNDEYDKNTVQIS